MPIFPFDPRAGGKPPIDPRYQATATIPGAGTPTYQMIGISNLTVKPIQELRDTDWAIYNVDGESVTENRSSAFSLVVFIGG